MTSIYTNVLSKEEVHYLNNLSEVLVAKASLNARPSGMVYFSVPVTESIRDALQSRFGLDISTGSSIPMRWIKGDTKPHVDVGRSEFQNTYLLYLNDSAGDFIIDSKSYPIQANTGFVFHEGLSHETQHTADVPRLLLGPMNELAEPVGVPPAIVYFPTESDALTYTNMLWESWSFIVGTDDPEGKYTSWRIASNSYGTSPKDTVYVNGSQLNEDGSYYLYPFEVPKSVNCCVPVNSDPRRFSPYVKPVISRSVPLSHEEYLRQKKNLRTTQLSGAPLIVGQAANYPRTVWTQSGTLCSDEPVVPNVLFAGAAQDAGLRTEMLQAVSGRGTISAHDGFNKNEWNTTLRKKGLAIINDPRFMNPAGDLRAPCTDCELTGTDREVTPGPTCVVAPPIVYPSHAYFLGLTYEGFGYSTDGQNWTLSPSAAFNYCQQAYTAAWNDSFFLLGGGTADQKGVLLVSQNGINWALSSPPTDPFVDIGNPVHAITAISASPTQWLLAATLNPLPPSGTVPGYAYAVFQSTNGFDWSPLGKYFYYESGGAPGQIATVTHCSGPVPLVGFNSAMDLSGSSETDALWYYNGAIWKDTDVFDRTFGVAYDNIGMYVAIGVPHVPDAPLPDPQNTTIMWSSNGTIWNRQANQGLVNPVLNQAGVAYGNGIWVAFGSNGSGFPQIWYNTTARIISNSAWTIASVDVPLSSYVNSASFVNGQWVATIGFSRQVYNSTDGMTWTLSTNPSFGTAFSTGNPVITVPMLFL